MTIPEKAVQWAVNIANDNSHGYDQGSRWGPDYDCSSLVISAYKNAGVPLACTYTGNMRLDMLSKGFQIVTHKPTSTSGLQPGDVLLNEANHTAMYIGGGMIVQASGNENGGATGGKTGDQTGREISTMSYYTPSYGWDYALRYVPKETATEPSKPKDERTDWYTVKQGDTLWGIAQRFLGSGDRYIQIMSANNLVSDMIHPGQVLIIPNDSTTTIYRTIQVTIKSETLEMLTIIAGGWNKTIGQVIDEIVEDAL